MLPEFGQFSLIIALCLALQMAIFPLIGASRGSVRLMRMARPLAITQFLFVGFSFIILIHAFIISDFSVRYVAENSNRALPLLYRICATWGAHEGSLLLWIFILNLWIFAVSLFSQRLPLPAIARVLSVMGMINIGFLAFLLFTSNPFTRLLPFVPSHGGDLNPILQDPGLAMHPPMLYMGYVGFSVAFAFAIAALISGRLDAAWARWSRPWTTAAWCFLTAGITLGSWWSYRQLGWGGWWFWDPVENASFLPWLVGTALMHSLAVTEKRSCFKAWTILLSITAFSLSLIGTFLVRSGLLTSVHAFAVDPARGVFMIKFIVIVVGVSLCLYAWRGPKIESVGRFSLLSRETFLMLNNILFFVIMLTVLMGTLYPLVLQLLNQGKISVGPPYFNFVFVPLMIPVLLLAGLGPYCRWKQDGWVILFLRVRWILLISIIFAVIVPWLLTHHFHAGVTLGVFLSVWLCFAMAWDLFLRIKKRGGLLHINAGVIAMTIAHIGLAVCALGIILSTAFSLEKDVQMQVGNQVTIAGYQFTFTGISPLKGPNYNGVTGHFRIMHQGKDIGVLNAQKRNFVKDQYTKTQAAILVGFFKDLYVSLGNPIHSNSWGVRIYYKPFIRWIWGGGFIMLLGGLISLFDKRYRIQAKK